MIRICKGIKFSTCISSKVAQKTKVSGEVLRFLVLFRQQKFSLHFLLLSLYFRGGLGEGVYRYRATTEVKGKTEEVKGEFLLAEQNQESQNLTADFGLLRNLAENTGGKFYTLANANQLTTDLSSSELKSLIHSEESFHPLINLKAVFFLLLLLISTEWFLRKYSGSY